jgi:hypothetical protein
VDSAWIDVFVLWPCKLTVLLELRGSARSMTKAHESPLPFVDILAIEGFDIDARPSKQVESASFAGTRQEKTIEIFTRFSTRRYNFQLGHDERLGTCLNSTLHE